MNYDQIKQSALNYADRNNPSMDTMVDTFLPMVESRINRSLRINSMSIRSQIVTEIDQLYYSLPLLFGGIRSISYHVQGSTTKITGTYLNPEQMNDISSTSVDGFYYTIIAGQLQIYEPLDEAVLEVIYYKRLTPLSNDNPENWVSERYPDLYLAGLSVEIETYVKNAESVGLWNQRYAGIIQDIEHEDSVDRWSGTSLTIKAG